MIDCTSIGEGWRRFKEIGIWYLSYLLRRRSSFRGTLCCGSHIPSEVWKSGKLYISIVVLDSRHQMIADYYWTDSRIYRYLMILVKSSKQLKNYWKNEQPCWIKTLILIRACLHRLENFLAKVWVLELAGVTFHSEFCFRWFHKRICRDCWVSCLQQQEPSSTYWAGQ